MTISKVDRIPLPGADPRTWPIVYTYEGTYDPIGKGHFEFNGEFEVNAFGGMKFNRHQVVSRSGSTIISASAVPIRPISTESSGREYERLAVWAPGIACRASWSADAARGRR